MPCSIIPNATRGNEEVYCILAAFGSLFGVCTFCVCVNALLFSFLLVCALLSLHLLVLFLSPYSLSISLISLFC